MAISRNELTGAAFVICAGMCWGTTGTIQALALQDAPSVTVGGMRAFSAGVILLTWTLARKGKSFFSGHWNIPGVFIAALGFVLYQLTFFSSLRLTGVAIGTMIALGSSPVTAGILGRVIFAERLSRRWFIATALAVLGCSMLALGGSKGPLSVNFFGIALALAAGFSYSFQGVGLRFASRGNKDPFDVSTAVIAIGGVLGLPWVLSNDLTWLLKPSCALAVLLLGVMSTILPYLFFTAGLRRISMGKAYTLTLSEPLTAWMLSTVVLGESLTVIGMSGVAVLFLGILILAFEQK